MTHVKAHDRAKPSKPQVYIDLHARLRAELEAQRRVNDYRASVDHKPDMKPVDMVVAIAGAIKRLAMTGRV